MSKITTIGLDLAKNVFHVVCCDVRGKRVLIVEDGPTVTHGGMPWGAGWVAARQYGAGEIVDPRPHARGSIQATYAANPHLRQVLPAMGYSRDQRAEGPGRRHTRPGNPGRRWEERRRRRRIGRSRRKRRGLPAGRSGRNRHEILCRAFFGKHPLCHEPPQ